jgi:hypothetical protein
MFTVDETIIPVTTQHRKDCADKEPMHPDDFEAHLAWITAKRFSERAFDSPFPENVVYFRILG